MKKKYKPFPPENGEVKILNDTGKWSLNQKDKPYCKGDKNKINIIIIDIINNYFKRLGIKR